MICYEYINDYIRKTIKNSTGILHEMEQYAEENHVPIIHPEVGQMLMVLGNMLKPQRILEVGTAIGYSAILFSQFLDANGRIDTIDRHERMIEKAKENIKKAGLEGSINIIMGEALEVLACLDKTYDMIFLDAAKSKYLEFLPQCLRMLRKGGLLVSDNVLYKGMVANEELVVHRKITIVKKMRSYLDYICNMKELETSIVPVGDGVALSYKK